MKVVFFSGAEELVDDLALGLRLRWPDLEPMIAARGEIGLQMIREYEPDLIFLCTNLPDMDLWKAIREIRRFTDCPIIVAQEGDDDLALVKAIELGADDRLIVPCSPMVVTARVVALMRRVGMTTRSVWDSTIQVGDLLVDPSRREALLGSERLFLTATEFDLLHYMVKNRHLTLTQEMIQREIWAGAADAGSTLKKYIQRLRRKLGDDARNPRWIHTIHGVGYRFTAPATTPV